MSDIFVFRQVDRRDISTFLQDGAIRSKNFTPSQLCHQTSYPTLVNRRGTEAFEIPTGGVVNDYVAFYFSPLTSFTFAIHKGAVQVISPSGKNLEQSCIEDRVFIVCKVDNLFDAGLVCCFSDYALNSNAPQPTVVNDLRLLKTHVHWDVFNDHPMTASIPEIGYGGVCRYFNDKAIPEKYQSRKSMRMAEFLVRDAVPIRYISCIATFNQEQANSLQTLVDASEWNFPILVKPMCFAS